MVGMGDEPVAGIDVGDRVGAGLDVDDLAVGVADDEVGRTDAPGGEDRQQRLVVGVGVENLAAAQMERLLIGVAPVVAGDEAVLDEADAVLVDAHLATDDRSEEHTSELQSLMRISYAVFCLNNKRNK